MNERLHTLRTPGPEMQAHASGALWLPVHRTLIVADLHLGYGFAQRRRGQLGPLVDEQVAAKMQSVIDELLPQRIVFLGDTVHAPRPSVLERDFIQSHFRAWRSVADLLVIRGNHDRSIDSDFEIEAVREWRSWGLIAVHGDREWPAPGPEETLAIGHLHPAVGVEDAAGVRQRVPVFLLGSGLLVLPAFSPFAAGLDVWKQAPQGLETLNLNAVAATGKRAVPIGPLARLVSPAAGSRAKDYQKLRYRRS
jgi:putative SbcD/Mre11-related phosphoesterase